MTDGAETPVGPHSKRHSRSKCIISRLHKGTAFSNQTNHSKLPPSQPKMNRITTNLTPLYIYYIHYKHTMTALSPQRLEHLSGFIPLYADSGENWTRSGHLFLERYRFKTKLGRSVFISVGFQPTKGPVWRSSTSSVRHEVWWSSPRIHSCWERRAN